MRCSSIKMKEKKFSKGDNLCCHVDIEMVPRNRFWIVLIKDTWQIYYKCSLSSVHAKWNTKAKSLSWEPDIHLKRVCSHLSCIVSNLRIWEYCFCFFLLLISGVGVRTDILHVKDNLIDGVKILDQVVVIENNILFFSRGCVTRQFRNFKKAVSSSGNFFSFFFSYVFSFFFLYKRSCKKNRFKHDQTR